MFTAILRQVPLAVLLIGLSPRSCGNNPVGPAEELRSETEHFIILSNTHRATRAEMEEGGERAEQLFAAISAVVGANLTPSKKITIRLEGDFTGQGPYFDENGVHLYRYSEQENGYWALIAHEMTHAFRIHWYLALDEWSWPTMTYYDEGFAEFVAQTVDLSKTGFSFYGFSEDVVVGYWVHSGQHIPHHVLRARHSELNQPCEFQAYPERASWLRYIDETFGREALLSIVYPSEEPTSEYIEGITGNSLEQLDAAWERWILNRFENLENAHELSQMYRERVAFVEECKAGVDY